jgi:hypothetical protein
MMWWSWFLFAASLVLQVFVINSLRRGALKDYAVVFAYSVVLLITTVFDGVVFGGLVSMSKASAGVIFYRNESCRQFMLFAVVISLIDRSLQAYPYRARVRAGLILAMLGAVLVSLELHASSSGQFIYWMTQVTRDLSFASVVLTLVLWLILISSRKKDHQLLMVTGGLGLQFTGEAIGQSLRQISQNHVSLFILGNLIGGVTHLLRLYVWREAFRRPGKIATKKEKPDGGPHQAFTHPAETLFETTNG